MATVTVEKNFTIHVPKDISKKMSIKEGDELIVKISGKDKIILIKKESIVKSTFGMWKEEVDGIEYVKRLRSEWERRVF